jgi:hypothetical protein
LFFCMIVGMPHALTGPLQFTLKKSDIHACKASKQPHQKKQHKQADGFVLLGVMPSGTLIFCCYKCNSRFIGWALVFNVRMFQFKRHRLLLSCAPSCTSFNSLRSRPNLALCCECPRVQKLFGLAELSIVRCPCRPWFFFYYKQI